MLKSIDKDWFFVYNKKVVKATYLGVAQLVACLNGVQEAASSNLATQTKRNPLPSWDSGFLLFLYIFVLYIVRIFLYSSFKQKSRGVPRQLRPAASPHPGLWEGYYATEKIRQPQHGTHYKEARRVLLFILYSIR